MKISVLIKDPGKKPRHVWIQDSLENLQRTVEGKIEAVTLMRETDERAGIVLIVNEEGIPLGLDYNADIYGIKVYGTIIICGGKSGEFVSLPLDWDDMKKLFPMLWEKPLLKLDNGWILASEHKPLPNEPVLGLCWGKQGNVVLMGAMEFVSWNEMEGWCLDDHEYKPVEEVRWWRPLPAHPVGEET